MAKLSGDDETYLREAARLAVRGGYEDGDEIEESLIDLASGCEPPLKGKEAQRFVRQVLIEEIDAVRREQASWPALTDYDRLRLAFDQLEDAGIIAREHFSCCGNCGAAEIDDEVQSFEVEGRKAKGYVFFHAQDTERAVEGEGLFFNYGAFTEPYEAESVAIGSKLYDTLASVGLAPDWNGKLETRVRVALDWKRPWTRPVPAPIKRRFF